MADKPPRRKKLIEVALPLEAINAASAREKSIRHGHPSTLHLWWARRPLAACRAVLFAQLVDDPSSDPAFHNTDGTVDEERAGIRRAELFNVIEELVKWENSNNTKVINAARSEIAASVASRKVELGELQKDTIVFGKNEGKVHPDGPMADDGTTAWRVMLRRSKPAVVNHFLATYAPPVLDPFAGGGSIPLEAQRLGLRARASDLNPIPVVINKALIEYPARFAGRPPVHPSADGKISWEGATGLAEDVRLYGKWMRDQAKDVIGHLYPAVSISAEHAASLPELKAYVGQTLTPVAWLWARTIPCPNPGCGQRTPLARSFWLLKKGSRRFAAIPGPDGSSFHVSSSDEPPEGTSSRDGARCLHCGTAISKADLRTIASNTELTPVPLAVVVQAGRKRTFVPFDAATVPNTTTEPFDGLRQHMTNDKRWFSPPLYGLPSFADLFTPRQIAMLTEFASLVSKARELVHQDASVHMGSGESSAYADAIATYLAEAVSKLTTFHNSLAYWRTNEGKAAIGLGRQAIAMTWDYCESNPFAGAGGDFGGIVTDAAHRVIGSMPAAASGEVKQADARYFQVDEAPVVATDPPYYDNIGYADLSDYFYVWLRPMLAEVHPELFGTLLTPKSDELIASRHRFGGDSAAANKFFESGLESAFSRIHQCGNTDVPFTLFYAFRQSEASPMDSGGSLGIGSTGWETMLSGLIATGFRITATWPMRTEQSGALKTGVNALASSIVLACVPRSPDAPMATRREFITALRDELPEAIRYLQSGNVAPVDLAQASIGPGMAAYSRYSRVVNADGSPMTVREALQLINQVLDESLTEQETDFDSETRFALKWFEQFGMKDGPYGDAEVLATAMAVSVLGVVEAGVAVSKAGKVRLLQTKELDATWDPQTDNRLTIWEVTHYLIRQLEQNGESAAAELLQRVGSGAGQTARELAYRLYQTCERKKWADWALSYNGLVVSWPEIERLSRDTKAEPVAADAGLFESE